MSFTKHKDECNLLENLKIANGTENIVSKMTITAS